MELIRGRHNLRAEHRGSVVTIGNFDGVHLGHRTVLEDLAGHAGRLGLPSTLVTFEPQPREYFQGEAAPARITGLREKLSALVCAPLDRVLLLRFDAALAATAPEAFVEGILAAGLGARHVVVGDDFRYGRDAAGDSTLLRRLGGELGFQVTSQATHTMDGERVSSSRVREALAGGDLVQARRLLGRAYSVCGRVIRGDALGRTIGYPTANLALSAARLPISGVFAARVAGAGPDALPGMLNVGSRPTVDGCRIRLEVHLLDWSGDLYGRRLEVEPVLRLRAEQRFESLEALRAQLGRDADAARASLAGPV